MHMIGISGRCASGARAPPAPSTPSPSTPAHVEGAHCVSERKTGCHSMQSPRLSEARFTMRWAYLILVSCPSRREARGIVDPSLQRRDEPSFFVPPFPLQVAVPEDEEADPNPTLHGHPECGDRASEKVRDRDEADQRGEEAKAEGGPRPHTFAPDIWTIRAFPRSTRICAIVFGSVTTSSFFKRYVVSIPAKGGTSSRTWTRTWSLSVGATGARLVSSARTTFIPAGFSFAVTTVDAAGGGAGSTPNGEPPKASVRDFLSRATMLSNRNRSWEGRFGTSTSVPLARLDAKSASFRSRYVKIWSRLLRTFRSSSWRRSAFGEFGSFWASLFADSSSRPMYAASRS